MRLLRILYAYFAVTSLAGYCQSSARLGEVQEPPELAGEPKKFTPPSKAMKQFAEAFPKDDKNIEQVRTGRDKLTKLLQENPDYSDGFLTRALFNRCMLGGDGTEEILKDIDRVIPQALALNSNRNGNVSTFRALQFPATSPDN